MVDDEDVLDRRIVVIPFQHGHQPGPLLVVEVVPEPEEARDGVDMPIENDEGGVGVDERVIGLVAGGIRRRCQEIPVVEGQLEVIRFVVAHRRVERCVSQQLLFDIEEREPLSLDLASGDHVTRMDHEIDGPLFQNGANHVAVGVVAGTGIAVDHEPEGSEDVLRRRSEAPPRGKIADFDGVGVVGVRFEPPNVDLVLPSHVGGVVSHPIHDDRRGTGDILEPDDRHTVTSQVLEVRQDRELGVGRARPEERRNQHQDERSWVSKGAVHFCRR